MAYEVVIAGAGPVGLFLACELRLAGVSVLVLERMEDTRPPLKANFMGMRGLNLPSVEAFYRRGLLNAVRESALGWMDEGANKGIELRDTRQTGEPPAPRFAGHFAGIMLDGNKIDFSDQRFMLPGPSASGGIVSMQGMETLLADHAKELGVEVRLGAAVTDITQSDYGVAVHVGEETIRADWRSAAMGAAVPCESALGSSFPARIRN